MLIALQLCVALALTATLVTVVTVLAAFELGRLVTRDDEQRQVDAVAPHKSARSPRAITVVVLATLLFLAPGRGLGAAGPGGGFSGGAVGGLGGGRGGGRGGFNGGHMGGGQVGHEHLGEGRGPGGRFRGHDFDHRGHHFDDDLGVFVYPYLPYYDSEPYEPGYDPYCDEDSPSYDARYCDVSP